MDDYSDFGKRLKDLRKHYQLTQKAFATRIGEKKDTYVRYEWGRRDPPASLIINLVQLDSSLSSTWLLTGEGNMHETPSRIGEAARIFAELTAKIDQLELTALAQDAEIQHYREFLAGLRPAELDGAARAGLKKLLAAIKGEIASRRRKRLGQ